MRKSHFQFYVFAEFGEGHTQQQIIFAPVQSQLQPTREITLFPFCHPLSLSLHVNVSLAIEYHFLHSKRSLRRSSCPYTFSCTDWVLFTVTSEFRFVCSTVHEWHVPICTPSQPPEQEKKDERPTDRTSGGVINSWLLHETLDCCSPGVQLKRVVFSFHNVPAAGQGIWKSEESTESVLSAKEIVYTFNGGCCET